MVDVAPRPERSLTRPARWSAGALLSARPPTGAPWFRPGQPYSANFPDPAVLRVGGTYYAYSTNTGGPSLPVMSSTDLVTWVARPAYDPGPPLDDDPWFNDALPRPARWARYSGGTRPRVEVWAPGVGQFGSTFVAFYAVRVSPVRMCISRATSSSPLGPFVDDSSRPLVCDADPAGSIDPQPFLDPASGDAYLLWKSE
ncbi:MAG: family 43 glycosylhydrolase, partial [Acidimicrobiia bacterium]|nr:family 43 glycosylhydrolase [Acidimicrobiia bacterium]